MTVEIMLGELCGGIWHTTTEERFAGILRAGEISPEPDIPNAERWSTRDGPVHWPYVRFLGGVSLFDFTQFDAETYSKQFPASQWLAFVPYPRRRDSAIWIEIDRQQVAGQLISGPELIAKWKSEEGYGHNIMPQIEAAHLGALPRKAFKRALLVRTDDDQFRDVLAR
jgi:hypothetical protein